MRTTKTTKLLALTLSLLMLLTMIPLSVSADETTVTILDVAQNDGNGNYWLEGNVTVTATYADEFTGTFDGKGYTVTTSVPLFNKVNGATIKNLTVTGAVTGYAAVASCVTGKDSVSNFENVTNKATVTNEKTTINDGAFGIESTRVSAGGIVCVIYNAKAEFIDCVNEGNVTAQSFVAGVVSYVSESEVTVKDCKNSGAITGSVKDTGTAGLIARGSNGSTIVIESSENTGTISGINYLGGILGYHKGTDANLSITKCNNSGEIVGTASLVGGIVGYLKNSNSGYDISYCYNTANVGAGAAGECGGIIGGLADEHTGVLGCYNSGKITGAKAAQIYFSNYTNHRGVNYYLSDGSDGVLAPYYISSAGCVGTAKSYSEADRESGKLAYTMNADIGQEIYFQNINTSDELKDHHPVLDSTHERVSGVGGEDSSNNGNDTPDTPNDTPDTPNDTPDTPNDTPDTPSDTPDTPNDTPVSGSDTNNTTTDEQDTDTTEPKETTDEVKDGGCGSVVGGSALMIAGAASLAGVAVTRKKKENN